MSRLHSFPRFFLSLALGLAAAFGVQAREMVSVQRAEVNLRAGAGTQHEALWVLSRGYPLEVTGRKGQWLKVRDFENDTGWIFRPLVGKKPHHVVKGSMVNLRSGPSTRSRIVGKATRGEVLRTLERRSQWVKVQQDGGPRGWVARRLLWGW
ncbi:MAG: SH3 domain-containing protein [Burkholderiaceae bacterium]|nr:SH3 domain-containing protein [Burkholderiaceae bacterium]